jgi:hypothetical protein
MTSRFRTGVFGAGLLAAAVSGCTATETGNPVTQQTLALTARSSSEDVSTGDSGASLRVSSAWIVLGDMRFVKSADCDRGPASRVDVEGPQAIELVENRDALALELEAASYCRVRVRLDRAKDLSGAPADLDDHSVLLRGSRADDTELVLRSRRNFDLDLRARGEGFDLTGARGAMILAFDLATWLDGVDLENAEPDANGVIVIDDQADRARLGVFEDNVKQAMELFRDRDRDSKLDEDDLDDSLAGG